MVNSDWYLQSLCSNTVPLFSDHVGQNLVEAFQDVATYVAMYLQIGMFPGVMLQYPLQIMAVIWYSVSIY